jgi:hypothetical protein
LKRPYWHGRDLFSPEVPGQPEEVLIADARAGLTPADMVERKLLFLLRGASVAGSHLGMGGPSVRGKVESSRGPGLPPGVPGEQPPPEVGGSRPQGPVIVSDGMPQRRSSGLNATHVPADPGELELDGDALEAVLDGPTN